MSEKEKLEKSEKKKRIHIKNSKIYEKLKKKEKEYRKCEK